MEININKAKLVKDEINRVTRLQLEGVVTEDCQNLDRTYTICDEEFELQEVGVERDGKISITLISELRTREGSTVSYGCYLKYPSQLTKYFI